VETNVGALRCRAEPERGQRTRLRRMPRMRVLVAVARPELPVQPERVETVVIPRERGLQCAVEVDERLIAPDSNRSPDIRAAGKARPEHVDPLRHVSLPPSQTRTLRPPADGTPVDERRLAPQCAAASGRRSTTARDSAARR